MNIVLVVRELLKGKSVTRLTRLEEMPS